MDMKERALKLYSGSYFARAVVRQLSLYGIPVGDVIDSLAAEAYNKLHVENTGCLALIQFRHYSYNSLEV